MSTVRRLPGPVADSWDWQRQGACRGRDSAQFFHPDGERGSSRTRRETAAKRVCASCPVRAECAAHALMVHEPYGVWGGFTETERLRLQDVSWEDLVDRRRGRADIRALEQRLGELGEAPPGDRAPSDWAPGDRAPNERAPGDRAPNERAPSDVAPGARPPASGPQTGGPQASGPARHQLATRPPRQRTSAPAGQTTPAVRAGTA